MAEANGNVGARPAAGRQADERCPLSTVSCPLRSVLYLDLGRTWRQYWERYSGGIPPEFANVDLGLLGDVATPEGYRGRRYKFLLAAVNQKLREGHRVVIIDNLAWLLKSEAGEIRSLIKGFRRWVNETGNSLLVLWHSSEVKSLALQAAQFELADSVFAMKRSTMGESIRYVKSFASRARNAQCKMHNAQFTFDLRRDVMVLRGNDAGFDVVGPSPERDHHHDYMADLFEAKRVLAGAKALLPPEKRVDAKRFSFLEIE